MKPYFEEPGIAIYHGCALSVLPEIPSESVQCCVTSPPYWGLRDYGYEGQIGLKESPDAYVAKLVSVFADVRRTLRDDGTLWLNLGDSYCSQGGSHDGRDDNQPGVGAKRVWRDGSGRADGIVDSRGQRNRNGNTVQGLKAKDLVGIPWRVAFALQADGWYLRSDIIWHKPNPMPESVTDRPTKAHEYLFLLTKSERYYYNAGAIAEPTSGGSHPSGERSTGTVKHSDSPNGFIRDKHKYPNGKHAATDPQTSGRRMVENVARARAAGAGHDSPFGITRNRRSVWTINTQPFPEAHFATFPEDLVTPCILAGARPGDAVLDPFSGSGTVGLVARRNGCPYIGIELNAEYCEMQKRRLRQSVLSF